MIWRTRKNGETKATAPVLEVPAREIDERLVESGEGRPDSSPAELLEPALDAVGALLREYGKNAFDVGETAADTLHNRCEQWAMHVLYAAPHPEGLSPEHAVRGWRDWAGLRQFYARQRRDEFQYVTRSMSDMQQVVWTFIQGLNQSLSNENETDARIEARLDKLKEAARSQSLETVKQEVLQSVIAIGQLVEERRREQRQQVETLYQRIHDLDSQLEEVRKESACDPLTHLFNRKTFDQHLTRTLQLHSLFGEPGCLLLADVDHFKLINDRFGHTVGDEVLRQLADCMTRVFPRQKDCLARYGGEEFGVILRDTPAPLGIKLAERLLFAVRELRLQSGDARIPVTLSIGFAAVRESDTENGWLERADRALYRAKQQGRNRIMFA